MLIHTRRRAAERTWIDGFCGIGGSTKGILRIPGVKILCGINHWDEALRNYEEAHGVHTYQCDLTKAPPEWFPTSQFAWFSPECDGNSQANSARGKRENAQQMHMFETRRENPAVWRSRMTAWDVVWMMWYHQYDSVIIENVTKFTDTNVFADFNEWLKRIHRMGYKTKIVYLNTQFLGVAQSRDRVYICCWRPDKVRREPDLDIQPRAWCERCGRDVDSVQTWKPGRSQGVYGIKNGQYFYRCPNHGHRIEVVEPYTTPAYAILDLTLPAPLIRDREALGMKPLVPKTLGRIRKGLRKFGYQAQVVDLAQTHSTGLHSRPASDPLFTQTSTHTMGVVAPLVVGLSHADEHNGKPGGDKVWPSTRPLPTQTTRAELGVATLPGFLVNMKGQSDASDITRPAPTFTAGGLHVALAVPFLSPFNGTPNAVEITRPALTITTVERLGLVVPDFPAFTPEPNDEQIEAMLQHCGFRMLEPATEIARAMDLEGYPFVFSSKRALVAGLGNAVVAKAAEVLAGRMMAAFEE